MLPSYLSRLNPYNKWKRRSIYTVLTRYCSPNYNIDTILTYIYVTYYVTKIKETLLSVRALPPGSIHPISTLDARYII